MIIRESNLYVAQVKKHDKKHYELRLEYPDGSRNFLHWGEMGSDEDLNRLLIIRDLITLEKIQLDGGNLKIVSDEKYYRINLSFQIETAEGSVDVLMHSRKLNLNDAVNERSTLITNGF